MSDSKRIKVLIEYLKKEKIIRNQQDFVERIGENRTVVSSYVTGKRHFSDVFILRIVDAFPFVSKKWLKGEDVDMLTSPSNMEQAELESPMDREKFVELGGEYFATEFAKLIKNGDIYTRDSYMTLWEEYRSIVREKEDKINDLNQEIGKLKAIIEVLKGKSPEDLLK